jgi:hypothetical protein
MILIIIIIIICFLICFNKNINTFIDIKKNTPDNIILSGDNFTKEFKIDKMKILVDDDLNIFKSNNIKITIPSNYIVKLYYNSSEISLSEGEYKVPYRIVKDNYTHILNKIIIVDVDNMNNELVIIKDNENKIVFFTLPNYEINWNWIYYMYGYNDYYVYNPHRLPYKYSFNKHFNPSYKQHQFQTRDQHLKYKLQKHTNNGSHEHNILLAKHRKY